MLTDYDLNTEFKDYGNQYEILRGIQINDEFIEKIRSIGKTKITVHAGGLKFVYEFRHVEGKRQFVELRIKNCLNITCFIGYKGDYIVRDKTGIYILTKEKFENQYSLMKYKKEKICS
ncbi:MAG: hypothetical protein WCY19_03415 [Candidatus Gastranaerophilaceae bacterium]